MHTGKEHFPDDGDPAQWLLTRLHPAVVMPPVPKLSRGMTPGKQIFIFPPFSTFDVIFYSLHSLSRPFRTRQISMVLYFIHWRRWDLQTFRLKLPNVQQRLKQGGSPKLLIVWLFSEQGEKNQSLGDEAMEYKKQMNPCENWHLPPLQTASRN